MLLYKLVGAWTPLKNMLTACQNLYNNTVDLRNELAHRGRPWTSEERLTWKATADGIRRVARRSGLKHELDLREPR